MKRLSRHASWLIPYASAVMSVAAALGLRLLLTPVLGRDHPLAVFLLAVIVTAWMSGAGPALLAVLLGQLALMYFLFDPVGSLSLASASGVIGSLLFMVIGVATALLAGSMHAARRRAADARLALEHKAAELDRANLLLRADVREQSHELSQTREELEDSLTRFRQYIEAAPLGIVVLDAEDRLVLCNHEAATLLGQSAEALLGRAATSMHPADRHAATREALARIRSTGHFEGVIRMVRTDGSEFHASIRSVRLDGGGIMSFFRDVTDELLAEEQLRLMIEGLADHAIFMIDPEGRVLTWPRGAEGLYGHSREEMIGQPQERLYPPADVASGLPGRELAEAAARGTLGLEGWRMRKSGQKFWASGSMAALKGKGGELLGFVKACRNISDKRRNDEMLHSILDHTLDGIITIDEHGTVLAINRAGEKIFGHPAATLVGQNVRLLMPEPHRANHDAYIHHYVTTGEAKIIGIGREVRGQRRDGTTFPMDLAITEFRLDDQRYFVGIVRDITRQKGLEAQLFQSQKMEAFGQFAGGVAHDFNNLLTVINGYSQILERMVPVTDGKAKMIGQIHRAGQRAASLTQQLLAFSRQQLMEARVLDINAVVQETETLLRRVIGEDIELVTLLRPGVSRISADPGQIEQVLLNVAVNARDAMPQGGKLTIETADIELDGDYVSRHPGARPGRFVMVAISDTGTGMTPDVQSRIFEPFFTTKGVGKGTGLGLAVAHGIVKQSGGTLDVYSELGIGTTFKLCLPAIDAEMRATGDSEPAGATRGSETLLLVEDDDNVRDFVAIALRSSGYTVLTAPDGRAAITLFADRRSEIGLLVTDVVMPEMSGRVLAETLRSEAPDLKVLFVSGYTDDAVVRHGILQADVAFLQKPFTPDALARKVREVLDMS